MSTNTLGNSQKRNSAMLDSDDLNSLSLSSPTKHSDNVMYSGAEKVLADTESLLDLYLDALYEKRCAQLAIVNNI